MFDTNEELKDDFATILFQYEKKEMQPVPWGHAYPSPNLKVIIKRNDRSADASSPIALIDAIRAVGLDPKAYAAGSPESVARAISYLEDKGRIVCNNRLYIEYFKNEPVDFDRLLPHFEDGLLVWNEIVADESGVPSVRIQQQTMDFAN